MGRQLTIRAVWADDTQWPQRNAIGTVYVAPGHYDHTSVAYGAYLFQPDGEEDAAYCSREHFTQMS